MRHRFAPSIMVVAIATMSLCGQSARGSLHALSCLLLTTAPRSPTTRFGSGAAFGPSTLAASTPMAGARGNVPADIAHVVAGCVLAHLVELQAASLRAPFRPWPGRWWRAAMRRNG